jgi:hypothetical protein
MNDTATLVWNQEGYTNLLHSAINELFTLAKFVPHTKTQIGEFLRRRFSWFTLDTDQRRLTFNKILSTGLLKWQQLGVIREVKSRVTVDRQWIAVTGHADDAYTSLTPKTCLAVSQTAKKVIGNRAVNRKRLVELNKLA